MGRAGVLQGVRQMRFEGLLERHERGELSQEEAAEMLGVSERRFRRWRDRLRDEGPAGLRDRRISKTGQLDASATPFSVDACHAAWDARSRIERSRQDPSRCRPRLGCYPSLWRRHCPPDRPQFR